MPFVLLVAGIVLLIAAVRNTVTVAGTAPGSGPGLFPLLQGDFTGPNNFVYWFLSILIIGAIGYVQKLKPISDAFLVLVIIVLFLKTCPKGANSSCKNGFFDQFVSQIDTTEKLDPNSIAGMTNSLANGAGLTAAQWKGLGLDLPSDRQPGVTIPR